MKLTDALFKQTYTFFLWQMFFYTIYFIPFMAQLLLYDHLVKNDTDDPKKYWDSTESNPIIVCNTICIIIALGFFLIEIVQIIILSFTEYSKQARFYEFFWFPV